MKGIRFLLRTDHSPLRQLLRNKGEDFSNRQLRWFERLSEFCFEVEHLPGQNNKIADALSRAYVISALEIQGEGKRQHQLGISQVKEAAQKDSKYQELLETAKDQPSCVWSVNAEGLLEDGGGRLLVPYDSILENEDNIGSTRTSVCWTFWYTTY